MPEWMTRWKSLRSRNPNLKACRRPVVAPTIDIPWSGLQRRILELHSLAAARNCLSFSWATMALKHVWSHIYPECSREVGLAWSDVAPSGIIWRPGVNIQSQCCSEPVETLNAIVITIEDLNEEAWLFNIGGLKGHNLNLKYFQINHFDKAMIRRGKLEEIHPKFTLIHCYLKRIGWTFGCTIIIMWSR